MDILTHPPKRGQWGELCDFWARWFHKPDTEALRVILSAAISHYSLSQPPVWFMLVGAPGSGKTSIAVEMLTYLPDVQKLDSPSINAFLSGFQDKGGLLARMSKVPGSAKKRHGILAYSDFSTMLHMPQDKRSEMMAIHRCLYDGAYTKPVGNKDELSWKGKCTCIAACTREVDRYYGVWGALGQRFLMVRWLLDSDLDMYTEKAYTHLGHEEEIAKEFRERMKRYTQGMTKHVDIQMPETIRREIGKLAILVSRTRGNVSKHQFGLVQTVTDEAAEEAPTRLAMSLSQLATASAKLARRPIVSRTDLNVAKRAAIDSIPPKRLRPLWYIPISANGHAEGISVSDLRGYTGQNKYSFNEGIQDLQACGIIEVDESAAADGESDEHMIYLTELGKDTLMESGVRTFGMIGNLIG